MTSYDDAIDGIVMPAAEREREQAAAQPGTRLEPVEQVALVDLLDRVLAGGVVAAGEVTLAIADVDMVTVSLRALVTSVSTLCSPQEDLRRIAE
jgi:Gas vesicle protein